MSIKNQNIHKQYCHLQTHLFFQLIIEKYLDEESLKEAIRIAADFFDYNPRRLKQYINALRLRIYITYYSIGVTFAETNTLNIKQISKFTALTLQYPRLLLALKKKPYLLGELEKYAVDKLKLIQPNNSVPFGVKSTSNNQKTGSANYWISNYPKIEKLLCNEKNQDNCIFQNASIKKLLEVLPQQQSLPPKYFKLRQFLAAQKWEEADYETYQVMLQVAGREEQGYLEEEDVEKFPCTELRIIDQLWVKYSDGKFGFSVQKQLYQSLGGTKEWSEKVWIVFGDKVGWYKEGIWTSNIDYPDHDLSIHGHLPRLWSYQWLDWWGVLLSRRDL